MFPRDITKCLKSAILKLFSLQIQSQVVPAQELGSVLFVKTLRDASILKRLHCLNVTSQADFQLSRIDFDLSHLLFVFTVYISLLLFHLN